MFLAGIQAEFGLDPRLKHAGVTAKSWILIQRASKENYGLVTRGSRGAISRVFSKNLRVQALREGNCHRTLRFFGRRAYPAALPLEVSPSPTAAKRACS